MRNALALALCLSASACASTLVWTVRSGDRVVRVDVVERSGRQRVIVGARAHPYVDAVGLEGIAVSADGRTVAYPALRSGRWQLSVNGSFSARYDGIGAVALSPDGRHVAFAAQRARRWRIVRDGREDGDHIAIMASSLRWSPRGHRLVYVARDADGERAVIDGVPQPVFSEVRALRFGDKDARVAYVARDGDGERVVVDGRAGPRTKHVTELALAEEGATVAWIAERDAGADLVVDGAVIASSPRTFAGLRVSASGARVACLRVNRETVDAVIDGRTAGTYDDAVAETLTLTRDGAHLTFVAVVDGQRAVVRDGRLGPRVDQVTELVSNDDGRWAWVGFREGAWSAWVDGRRVRRERAWMGGITVASGSSRYALLIRRDGVHTVRDDLRERPVGAAFSDSLTFDARGARWGCIAGTRPGSGVSFVFEGGERRPIEREEFGAMLLGGRLDRAAVTALVRAELSR